MPSGGIKDIEKLTREIRGINDKAETFMKRTMSDARKRGPSWIAQGVAEEYKVTRKAVTSGDLGRLSVKGNMKHLRLKYSGQRIDLTKFNLTPKTPKKTYTLKVEVRRGQKVAINKVGKPTKKQYRNIGKNFRREGARNSPSSPVMLMNMGNTEKYLPFQRTSQNRTDFHLKRAIALPQMVTEGKNGPLHPAPAKYFNAGLEKRVENHRKQLLK